MVKIINVAGTSNLPVPEGYDSFFDYWKGYEEGRSIFHFAPSIDKCPCCKRAVFQDDLVGGHVRLVDDRSDEMYIVPMCKKCNASKDIFEVDKRYIVPIS